MAIARAFTLRHKRTQSPPSSPAPNAESTSPKRSVTAFRRRGITINRTQISAPVELISTTNMLSYNAPDVSTIFQMRQPSAQPSATSSTPSVSSAHESDVGSAELTDASSVGESPSPKTPELNHLSYFFEDAQKEETKKRDSLLPSKDIRRSRSVSSFDHKTASSSTSDAPVIPRRAPSHSKTAHMQLARKRSLQSLSSDRSASATPSISGAQTFTASRNIRSSSTGPQNRESRASSSRAPRSSADLFNDDLEPDHPFGKELEQLNEVAEDFGGTIRDAEAREDLAIMKDMSLLKWSADEYLSELTPLYIGHFSTRNPSAPAEPLPSWI